MTTITPKSTVNYLGFTLEVELLSEIGDYHNVASQCLRIRNKDNPEIQARWAVICFRGQSPVWSDVDMAISDSIGPRKGFISAIKHRLQARKYAKYLTNNHRKASAKSLRMALKEIP